VGLLYKMLSTASSTVGAGRSINGNIIFFLLIHFASDSFSPAFDETLERDRKRLVKEVGTFPARFLRTIIMKDFSCFFSRQ